ncbi:DUF4905 domain-containing protein [Parapedobacter sp. 10938]|uniref:DUF4905 domain-containing protein n=1 Tax=Parapedobacter flavus TaxID=3110225 RepID=UPI002DBBE463|nr:DUF4905 domain-containing protein [Parapedobacter sp. 10938]MEC3880351.1 DUF4905 domain-containing protein [Parapedobacter sp. 10938]
MDKYTLKTVFKKSFLGMVWRIEADTAAQILAIETRDRETGQPFFSVFDYQSGRSFTQEKPYGDRNWTLAGLADRKLILKAFGQNSPNGTGIACIDIDRGELLWEQFNYVLVHVGNRQLTVRHRNFAGGYEQYLDVVTGNLTPFNNMATKPTEAHIVLPQRYDHGIPACLDGFPVHGDLFYYQIGQKQLWGFHEAIQQAYRVRLVITSGLTVLADEVVLPELAKMTPELFFMIGQQVFIMSDNKREIVSYLV